MQLEKQISNFKNVCFYINFVFLIVRSVLQVHVDVDVDVT